MIGPEYLLNCANGVKNVFGKHVKVCAKTNATRIASKLQGIMED